MRRSAGFTLVELLVVLAIVALLLTIAVPRYIDHVERARETTLKASLKTMRDAIDKFEGDTGRLPESIEELVARRYLREMPIDPFTQRRDSWVAVSAADLVARLDVPSAGPPLTRDPRDAPDAIAASRLADVHSGAEGSGRDGTPLSSW
jgi:prepilin-type N-terminal cleavage/methylation domain-containing protein